MFVLAECDIPPVVTGILSQVYKIIIILIPLGMVIFGSIDFIKAIMAKDENAIASSTKTFVSRLIAGGCTFFVLTIVSWLFTKIIGNVGGASSAMQCAADIIGGTAGSSSSNNLDWVYDAFDADSARINCQNECNEYCRGTAYSACSSYCSGGKKFNKADANSICPR